MAPPGMSTPRFTQPRKMILPLYTGVASQRDRESEGMSNRIDKESTV
jgi:hypothetical protein